MEQLEHPLSVALLSVLLWSIDRRNSIADDLKS